MSEDAIDGGLTFLVFRHQIVTACPLLLELVQEAGNMGHGIARVATKLQTMQQVHTMALRHGDAVDWRAIATSVERHRPWLAGQAADLCAYVGKWSGGQQGHLLKDLDKFAKGLPVNRELSAASLGALAKVDIHSAGLYVTAVVKAMLAAPAQYVRDSESRLFTSSDIAAIGGRCKPHVVTAIEVMAKCREIVAAAGLDMHDLEITKAVSDLDVRLVMHVHGKVVAGRGKFASLQAIGATFQRACSPWGLYRFQRPSTSFFLLVS
jgi:hypothetical protein